MTAQIVIQGGRLAGDVAGPGQQADILIDDGVIQAVEAGLQVPEQAQVLDARGCLVSAGFIDLSHALRQPGFEHKGSIDSETRAAAKGGFTAICSPPATAPVNDSAAVTNLIFDHAVTSGRVRVLPVGAMTKGLEGEQLSNMHSLREAGCVAVTNLRQPFRDNQVMKRCLEYACSQNIRAFICPQDAALAREGCAHEGLTASRLGLSGIPAIAEVLAVAQWLILAEETEAPIHFSQLSAARSVSLIEEARARGLAVTADVAIANLMFNDEALSGYNSMYHVQPPLRSEQDRLALLDGVNRGVIDAICSHHEPHESAAKQAPFAETAPGMSQAELLLPQVLTLIDRGELTEDAAFRALTSGPARVIGELAGTLVAGAVADIVVVDPALRWRVSGQTLVSRGWNTPWLGQTVAGAARYTILDGAVVFASGDQG